MKRLIKEDEFFKKQPPLLFLKDLKAPYHTSPVCDFKKEGKREGEIYVDGIYIKDEFCDKDGLFDSAKEDFNLFASVYDIGGNAFPLILRKGKTERFEAYKVTVTKEAVIITANDTEGIRRGIYFVEDMIISREAPFMALGETKRVPHIRKRITRGFFSPTNRAPKFGDELSDDIDYYDENYLNRLAHDGTNGLWIYTRFSDLVKTKYIPQYGVGSEKRIEKLKRVIDKCARYGIGVYIFAIEPEAPRSPEIYEKHGDMLGGASGNDELRLGNGVKTFCPHTKKGRAYLIEATEKICLALPSLAGFISITAGERVTSCAAEKENKCPICGHIPRGENLAFTADCLKEGIRRSGTKAEFVSWTYGHRLWNMTDIEEYVKYAPKDVMLMQNFDDMGYEEQLGKMRQGVDYWLSYPGPSDLFTKTALAAKKYGKTMYAKTQVCTSHEIATIPYVPVPGIIFDKFRAAFNLGVEGMMECWYFGNYPSIMSKAAGELSFLHDFSDKDAFLMYLASIYCGESSAKALVDAWNMFEKGYKLYPLNVMFSYYGPMHDSVCWQLHLKPKNFSLPRSWLLQDRPDGDRIYECLGTGHTPHEVITLTEEMASLFEEGYKSLENVPVPFEHKSVTSAAATLFRSGNNILRFYKMREMLNGFADAEKLLSEMRDIVEKEKINSEKMIELCKEDGRLGYHSEAEGYKFFPEKIEDRIKKLDILLEEEFTEVSARIKNGLVPIEYFDGVCDDEMHHNLFKGNIKKAEAHMLDDNKSFFKVSYDEENLYVYFCGENPFTFTAEFTPMELYPPIVINPDHTASYNNEYKMYYNIFGERETSLKSQWKCEEKDEGTLLTLKRADILWQKDTPIKIRVTSGDAKWISEENPTLTLGKMTVSPYEFSWFMP